MFSKHFPGYVKGYFDSGHMSVYFIFSLPLVSIACASCSDKDSALTQG